MGCHQPSERGLVGPGRHRAGRRPPPTARESPAPSAGKARASKSFSTRRCSTPSAPEALQPKTTTGRVAGDRGGDAEGRPVRRWQAFEPQGVFDAGVDGAELATGEHMHSLQRRIGQWLPGPGGVGATHITQQPGEILRHRSSLCLRAACHQITGSRATSGQSTQNQPWSARTAPANTRRESR